MAIGMTRMLHVKLPVTDLQASVTWYCELMDLALWREFIEDGEVRGAALRSEEGGFSFALRIREYCESTPDLNAFDIVALHISDRDRLEPIRERAQRLGASHTEVQGRGPNEAIVDVTDPDGTVLRFYWVGPDDVDEFVGMDFSSGPIPGFIPTPRLTAPRIAGR